MKSCVSVPNDKQKKSRKFTFNGITEGDKHQPFNSLIINSQLNYIKLQAPIGLYICFSFYQRWQLAPVPEILTVNRLTVNGGISTGLVSIPWLETVVWTVYPALTRPSRSSTNNGERIPRKRWPTSRRSPSSLATWCVNHVIRYLQYNE